MNFTLAWSMLAREVACTSRGVSWQYLYLAAITWPGPCPVLRAVAASAIDAIFKE